MDGLHDHADQRSREGRRVTLVGALVNLVLGTVQIAAGWLGRSQALVADGVHTFSDLCTDVIVWLGLRFSAAPPDAEHPWGHGKIETIVAVVVGVTLALVGFGLGSEAIRRLREGGLLTPTGLPLLAAAIAIVSKEAVYRWTIRVGRRLRSQALVANAWHHRSDAFSSVAALLGVAGARAGLRWMDAAAAAVVSLFIVKVGVQVAWSAIQDLMERQLEPDILARVAALLQDDPDVVDTHRLRLRNIGGFIVGDVHLTVDGGLTVWQGHAIADRLERRALAEVTELMDLVIHLEPDGGAGGRKKVNRG